MAKKIYMLGIDISNHQGKANMDLDKVLTKHPEIRVVIIKSSEGTNFDDAYDEEFIRIALAHGCIVGVYHFARPDKNGWLEEAKLFLSLTIKYKGMVFYVLDWERNGSVSWAKSFLDYVAKETGSTPIFYSYESRINGSDFSPITKYPLWVAKYRDHDIDKNFDMSNAGKAPQVKWWDSYIGWQWTSVGRLDGYGGDLDCSAFYIDEGALRKCIGAAPEQSVKFTHSRSAIVTEAIGHIGVKEGTILHHKIIDRYNAHTPLPRGYKVKYTDAWCATFVSFLAIVMGYTDIIPVECSCPKMIELAKKMGCWVENDGYLPEPGDIPLYDWQDSGKGDNTGVADHIGIVEKVVNGKITVIEGNYQDAVGRREIAVNGRYIRGYIVPKYDDDVETTSSGQAEAVDDLHTVKWTGRTKRETRVYTQPDTSSAVCSFSPVEAGVDLGVCKRIGKFYFCKIRGKYGYIHKSHIVKT